MKWEPLPIQAKFLAAKEDEVLFGGAKGGTKTESLLVLCIMRAMKYPETSNAFFRRAMPELKHGGGPIPRAQHMLKGIADWSARDNLFKFPNQSTLEFGYCDREEDVYRYDGAEFPTLAIDQVEQFTEFQVDYLRSLNRSTIPGMKSIMRLSANPQGIGMGWLRRSFINHTTMIDGVPQEGRWDHSLPDGDTVTRAFIPARLEDNKYLSGTDYKKKLMSITDEKTRKALLEGRWDLFIGQYFTEFDPKKHVGEMPIHSWHQKFVGIDYAYSAPFCALWASLDEHGRVHVYKELYQARLTDEEQAARVLSMNTGEQVMAFKADPSSDNKRGETGRSAMEVWAQCGLHVIKANNEREIGWSRIRSLLSTSFDGIPLLTIHPRCVNLIREMSDAVHDKRKEEDLDTTQSDHALDALRYIVSDMRNLPSEAPVPVMFDFHKLVANQERQNRLVAELERTRCY